MLSYSILVVLVVLVSVSQIPSFTYFYLKNITKRLGFLSGDTTAINSRTSPRGIQKSACLGIYELRVSSILSSFMLVLFVLVHQHSRNNFLSRFYVSRRSNEQNVFFEFLHRCNRKLNSKKNLRNFLNNKVKLFNQ